MADDLAQNLQPASYRGVPFHVDGSTFEAGRRTQVNEYPQRDQPYAQDLGRATRAVVVDAILVGADYIEQANALIAAAEEEGPGTLVHPWLGAMQVSQKTPVRFRFDSGLGKATVSFDFVESGELEFPSALDSTQTQSQLAADSMCTAAAESFSDSFTVDGFSDFVSDMARSNFSAAFDFASSLGGNFSALSGWASQLGALSGNVLQLLADPLGLAQQVMDWFDLSDIVASLAGSNLAAGPTYATSAIVVPRTSALSDMALGIVGLAGNGGASGVLNAPLPALGATSARRQQVVNAGAINGLVRRALLAQAVGMSSVADTTVQTDAHRMRDALCAALDAESLLADDASYEALQIARRAVWTDITARSSGGARLIVVTPNETTPALVLAYEQYEDAGRADEVASRNHVIHPGFVPAIALQVLSR
ncbi:DNA circularization protein [Variovorax sp. RCC_210]|uniref:DNA circularization protein n=1 Tax=Variovorax sp. RCC_210 TaxID=3239217 RepID=UPI003523E67C